MLYDDCQPLPRLFRRGPLRDPAFKFRVFAILDLSAREDTGNEAGALWKLSCPTVFPLYCDLIIKMGNLTSILTKTPPIR